MPLDPTAEHNVVFVGEKTKSAVYAMYSADFVPFLFDVVSKRPQVGECINEPAEVYESAPIFVYPRTIVLFRPVTSCSHEKFMRRNVKEAYLGKKDFLYCTCDEFVRYTQFSQLVVRKPV